MKRIKISLNDISSIGAAIVELTAYEKDIDRKCDEFVRRLADMGAVNASLGFARAIYTGPSNYDVEVKELEPGKYSVEVRGESILFQEFGAGITYGAGHPLNAEFGYGPGTYPIPPGKGHWNDPNGWYLPRSKGGLHTYGNPPNMPMYNTAQDLRREIQRVAREVFGT